MKYRSGQAMRAAIEDRLLARARARGEDLQRLRKLVAFDRFVERVQAGAGRRLLLKGGFAMVLRFGARARTTRDIDLAVDERAPDPTAMQTAAAATLGDFFEFQVGIGETLRVTAPTVVTYRHSVSSFLDGRPFEAFHVDLSSGNPVVGRPSRLPSTGLLDFAGLGGSVRCISRSQQFAEKIHALTLPRSDNSRTHDLVDLMLLLDGGPAPWRTVRTAVDEIFEARRTHPVPAALPDPPASWMTAYTHSAADSGVTQRNVVEAMARLRSAWSRMMAASR